MKIDGSDAAPPHPVPDLTIDPDRQIEARAARQPDPHRTEFLAAMEKGAGGIRKALAWELYRECTGLGKREWR